MTHNGCVTDRRRFLATCAAAPAIRRALQAARPRPPGLRLEFQASAHPPVPPPLRIDPPPRLLVEFSDTSRGAACSLDLRVLLNGEPCRLPLAMWTGNDQFHWHAREAANLPAYRGSVTWSEGRWTLSVSGRTAFEARPGPRSGGAAELEELPRATFAYALEPNWGLGPLGRRPVELWLLRERGGASPLALDLAGIAAEGDLDGWLSKLGASGPVSATGTGLAGDPAATFAQDVDPAAFEPFALRNYPEASGALALVDTSRLQPEEIEAYRERPETRLSDLLLVSVDATVDAAAVKALLPPPCIAPRTAVVRALAVRGLESPGLDEAWLLAQCSVDGSRAWYAVSHVRGAVAGAAFGREVLGRPTRRGSVTTVLGASQFAASAWRGEQGLFHAEGFYGGFSTGTSLAEMPVATLRQRPGPAAGQRRGEIVLQHWYFQGLRKPVRRESLNLSFPATGSGVAPDAWNRLGPAKAYWAALFDSATMQRLPGEAVAQIEDVSPYYRDRCDGRLPWEAPSSSGSGLASS